jgi:RNA chaperone Hfq
VASPGNLQALQDTVLEHLRQNRVPVRIFLTNGVRLQGYVTGFDSSSSVKKAAWALRRVWGWRGTRYAGPREPPREGRTKP